MAVVVQYIVKVSDVDRFVATSEKFPPMMEEMGGKRGGVYEDENNPASSRRSPNGTATTRCTPPRTSTAIRSTRRLVRPG
jgi:hypothetical protein